MSTSSPTNASPEKLGQGSRKSSLNAFTTPPSGDKESDDDGYVTAEDDPEGPNRTLREVSPDSGAGTNRDHEGATRGTSDETSVEPGQSGVRGLMGRMRL